MSERISVRIDYQTPFSAGSIEKVLQAASTAIEHNWQTVRDQWSTDEPEYPVNIAAWLSECTPERMTWYGLTPDDPEGYWATRPFELSFSPLSLYVCWLFIYKQPDDQLSVDLSVKEWALYEFKGEREQRRMEWEWDEIRRNRGETTSGKRGPNEEDPRYDEWWEQWNGLDELDENVWPQNKKCLQHIIERLKSALPVRSVEIDEELRDGDTTLAVPPAEQQP